MGMAMGIGGAVEIAKSMMRKWATSFRVDLWSLSGFSCFCLVLHKMIVVNAIRGGVWGSGE